MRIGSLLVQIIAILIAVALIAGGYYLYRIQEVSALNERINLTSAPSWEELMQTIKSAPSAYCTDSASNFDGAIFRTRIFHNGKGLFIDEDRTDSTVSYSVFNNGWYEWDNSSDEILFASLERAEKLYDPAKVDPYDGTRVIFSESKCSVWWFPDESKFDIPANMPIIEA